jgi:predicted lipoprotein with Yx(FWY)xxD motif
MYRRMGTDVRQRKHVRRETLSRASTWRAVALAAVSGAALVLAACGSSSSTATTTTGAANSNSSSTSAPPSGVVDASTVGSHGVILVSKTGATIYHYTPDGTGPPTCTGACAGVWPPVTVPAGSAAPTAGSGVTAADLGTVARPDGTIQVTYKHMPLYTYTGDTAPGQANGQGVAGIWFVITASGGTSTSTGATTATTAARSGY